MLISGAPGAGKTTLALPLASRLGWPLITKDHIKETLFDAMGGVGGSLEESRRFGAGAMETLWALAARCPQVVLEANFRPRSDYERARLSGLNGRVVEVHCACPVSEAIRRFGVRGRGLAFIQLIGQPQCDVGLSGRVRLRWFRAAVTTAKVACPLRARMRPAALRWPGGCDGLQEGAPRAVPRRFAQSAD